MSSFLPWHRELCNRLEALLREVDPKVSLHYWDFTTDPRASDNGIGGTTNLFTDDFMGNDDGDVSAPFESLRGPIIKRKVDPGPPSPNRVKSDEEIISNGDMESKENQWKKFRENLEDVPHNYLHGYIGGSIEDPDTAFEDPFVFLLHSNIDRLWAKWQLVPGKEWRLDSEQVYGIEENDEEILKNMWPWDGSNPPIGPWAPPENMKEVKNCKDPSIVKPPPYDTNPS